jgi:hypothetical protein
MAINVPPTSMGWLYFMGALFGFGILGVLGGIVFFFTLKKLGDPLSPGLSVDLT